MNALPMLSQRLPILKSLQWVAKTLLKQAGFRLELRRNGDLKIGLWRKTLRKRAASDKKTSMKRFVLVPGFGDSPMSWIPVLTLLTPALKKQFDEVVLLDFPGFNGFLSKEKSFHSMDLLMSAVGDVFDSLEPDTILGHSLGGWLTSRYAIEAGKGARPTVQKRHGYRGPKTVVLANPSGVFPDEEMRSQFAKIFSRLVSGEGLKALRPHLFGKEPLWFRYIVDEYDLFARDEGITQFTQSIREDHSVQAELGHIQAATWIIWGDSDSLIPSAGAHHWLEGLKASNAPAQAVLLKDVGHSPQLECPAVLSAVLAQIMFDRKPHARGSRWWKVLEKRA